MVNKLDHYIYLKIGKKTFVKVDILSALVDYLGKSRSDIKRLMSSGAIDIYIPEIFKIKDEKKT